MSRRKRRRNKKSILPALLLLAALVLFALLAGGGEETPEGTQPPETSSSTTETQTGEEYLYVSFIDVGQADCTLLKLGDCDILIDGGNVADGKAVVDYLNRQGVDDLELVISTHAHEDHSGGLTYVLNNFTAEQVWVTTSYYNSNAYTNFINAMGAQGLPVYIPSLGEVFSCDGLTVTLLGPVEEYDDTNDTSLIVMAEYCGKRFLFTGDMETGAEADLVASGADLSADVLKVGHHGSYTSSSAAFLAAVGAKWGVIHVGVDNDYGHPHDEAMDRLFAAGLTLYRTDTMGTVVIATNGGELAFMWDNATAAPETAAG